MAEAKLIPQRMAELLRLCLDLDATYTHLDDLQLEPLTDVLPEAFRELIEQSLPEYCPIMVYTAPRKEKNDPLHMLIAGHKARQWYALNYGLPGGDYVTCMPLLREAADRRRAPWHYWEPEARGWTIASAIFVVVTAVSVVVTWARLEVSIETMGLMFAQLAVGAGLSLVPLTISRMLWNERAKKFTT